MRAAAALLLAVVLAAAPAAGSGGSEEEVAAARALFEANLEAIRQRDRDAYLACYLDSDRLARTGPGGVSLGFEGLAASAGSGWPEVFDARDLRLVRIRPGVVYGTYRYRVRFDGVEQSGLSERLFVATEEGWKIAVTTAFPSPAGTHPPPLALVGATLIDGTGATPRSDAVVLIREGRVECAGGRDDCAVPAEVEQIDLTGQWITPGLIDGHVHFSQTGWADGRPDFIDVRDEHPYVEVEASLRRDPERFFRSYLCSGVTAVFDVGGYPWTWGLAERAEASTEAPHVAAAGPLLSTLDFWLNLPGERQFIHLADEATAREGVRYLAAHGAGAAKVWFIRHEGRSFEEMAAAVRAAGDEAERLGLPLIVHATGLEEAKEAVRAGASLLVHSVWDLPVDDELVELLLERGTAYTPTLTVARGYLRLLESAAAGEAPGLDDPNGCVDPATRTKVASSATIGGDWTVEQIERRRARVAERERLSAANLLRLARAGVPIVLGTDAGNPLTLHGSSVHAELEAMQAAGMTAMEVIVAATREAARAMGRGSELGTIEAGKAADLLVLSADPVADVSGFRQLRWVVRGGEMRAIEELAAVAGRP